MSGKAIPKKGMQLQKADGQFTSTSHLSATFASAVCFLSVAPEINTQWVQLYV